MKIRKSKNFMMMKLMNFVRQAAGKHQALMKEKMKKKRKLTKANLSLFQTTFRQWLQIKKKQVIKTSRTIVPIVQMKTARESLRISGKNEKRLNTRWIRRSGVNF